MGDKLDSTIDAVASMSRNIDAKPPKSRRNSKSLTGSSTTRKRKLTETEVLERPSELAGTSWEEDSHIDVTDEPQQHDTSVDVREISSMNPESGAEEAGEEGDGDDGKNDDSSMEKDEKEQDEEKKKEKEEPMEKIPTVPRPPSQTETDPMSVWTASDDLALISAASHVSCLQYIHNTLPFSRKFSLHDLETRINQLFHDEKWSELAWKRIDEMPARLRLHIEARTPFTRGEEKTLMVAGDLVWKGAAKKNKNELDTHTMLTIEHFKKILEDNSPPFHRSRTPQILSDHFRRIKGYREISKDSEMYSYEALELKKGIKSAPPVDIHAPLIASRARYHAISRYPLLRVLQNNFQTSASIPDSAVAIIHGRFLQYSMTGKQAIMGRQSIYDKVDIDLSKEGPAAKVSRQQAVITHVAENEFRIQNIGQRPMYVDSKPLPQGVGTSLKHGSIIEVAALRLIFSIPVPRELHPLIRNVAMQHLQAQRGGPPAAKKPRPGKPPGALA